MIFCFHNVRLFLYTLHFKKKKIFSSKKAIESIKYDIKQADLFSFNHIFSYIFLNINLRNIKHCTKIIICINKNC